MAISESSRSTGASSHSDVCKGWKAPFKRCYCGEEALCAISWSDKHPCQRYYGCRYWPNPEEECGYFEWYDDEPSDWFKQVLNDLKPKKRGKGKSFSTTSTLGKASVAHHHEIAAVDKVIVGLLVLLVIMVGSMMVKMY